MTVETTNQIQMVVDQTQVQQPPSENARDLDQSQKMVKSCQRQLAAQSLRILHLEQELQCANAKLLISGQIKEDRRLQEKDFDEMYREEIDELKENLERKEYLLQFNE